jgi:hypothetical protein
MNVLLFVVLLIILLMIIVVALFGNSKRARHQGRDRSDSGSGVWMSDSGHDFHTLSSRNDDFSDSNSDNHYSSDGGADGGGSD